MSDPARGPADGPTIAGVYDYWLGGGQHRRADRDLAEAIAARYPSVPAHIRAAQEFHLRAARWCAGRGISRFVHAGHLTALPAGRNVHDAARSVSPGARVIYAYRDAGAFSLSGGMLAGDRGVTAVLSGEGGFLGAGPVREMLADGEPVCLIAGLLLHFAPAGRAAARVARGAAALPPGSVFAASVAIAGDTPRAAGVLAMFSPAPVYRHSVADLERWLADAGLETVGPGVTDVQVIPGLTPEPECGEAAAAAPGFIAGVLARKP